VPERRAEAALREAEPVVRRGVEEADAVLPGGVDGGAGLRVGDRREEVAEGRGAQAEPGKGDHVSSQTSRRPPESLSKSPSRRRFMRACQARSAGWSRSAACSAA